LECGEPELPPSLSMPFGLFKKSESSGFCTPSLDPYVSLLLMPSRFGLCLSFAVTCVDPLSKKENGSRKYSRSEKD
jgi:hypothetical protein